MTPHDFVNRWVESTRSAAANGPGDDEPVERIPSPDLSEDEDDEVRPKDLPVNVEYYRLLENAKMIESHGGPAPEHRFLYESFKREVRKRSFSPSAQTWSCEPGEIFLTSPAGLNLQVLLDALPEDEALEKALISLRTLTVQRITHSLQKRTLCAPLGIIIEVSVGLCVMSLGSAWNAASSRLLIKK
jgi:hypothetical protein